MSLRNRQNRRQSCTVVHWGNPMLTQQNIESELSYAYLHAVANTGWFGCVTSDRHHDNAGIDATVREDGKRWQTILSSLRLNSTSN